MGAAVENGAPGAGSPQAQRIQIGRQMGHEEKNAFAKRLAGIEDQTPAG